MTDQSPQSSREIAVFISGREATCDECGQSLGAHAWITVREGKAACLSCSDLDHLVFLASGNAALTRRAKKHSKLSAVVLKRNWMRKPCASPCAPTSGMRKPDTTPSFRAEPTGTKPANGWRKRSIPLSARGAAPPHTRAKGPFHGQGTGVRRSDSHRGL